MSDMPLETAFSLPSGFRFGEMPNLTEPSAADLPAPSLGPLAAFTGTFKGNGFNTIFRPDSTATPALLPVPVSGSDNVLELNLTLETLSFTPSLGSVPNRGMGPQGDIFLNGVAYLQTIIDDTVPSRPVGIHFEPGLWMAVPPTGLAEDATVARMALIPHDATVEARGTSSTIAGEPTIPAVDITPFLTASPHYKMGFPSQDAANDKTARIPQNLASFIAAGTITQAMLTDPNTLLRNHIASQTITSTTTISVSSDLASAPNARAHALKMEATFWIEIVEFAIKVPNFEPGQPPLIIPAETGVEGQPVPEFLVNPPVSITAPRSIAVKAPQIQYSQQVFLDFIGLSWPHVSVATLVPSSPVPVPPSAWT